jgi:hypothetical protein
MASVTMPRSKDEIARLAMDILRNRIEPTLPPEDKGKFVVIDVDSGEFEMDANEYQAYAKLNARLPDAEMFLARVGYLWTHRAVGVRCYAAS